MSPKKQLTDEDYSRLLEFRTGLRIFLKWSQDQAAEAGLAPAQHQLLLAIQGHSPDQDGPTVGQIARYLLIKAHSAAELASRAEAEGLIKRIKDAGDKRVVRLKLTTKGHRKIERLATASLEELGRLSPRFRLIWNGLEPS